MRKVLEWGIGVLIFLSAVAYIPGRMIAETQLNVLKIGVPILFLLALMVGSVRSVKTYFIPAIGLLCFVNTLLLKATIAPLVSVLLGVILFHIILNYVEDFRPLYIGMGAVIILTLIMVILQMVNADPVCFNEARGHNKDLVGLFGFKYVFGIWMAIATPFLLFSKKWYFGILSAILTICSFSYACITLMTLAIIYGIGRLRGWKIAVGLLLIALLSGYMGYTHFLGKTSCGSERGYFPQYSEGKFITMLPYCKPCTEKGRVEKGNHILSMSYKIKTRWHLESELLKVPFSKPLTGYGLSSAQVIGPRIFNSKTDIYGTMVDFWNEWLERYSELGVWIVFIFFTYAFMIFRKFGSRKDYGLQGSLAIIPFGMLFHTYFIHTSICVLVLTLLARREIEAVNS